MPPEIVFPALFAFGVFFLVFVSRMIPMGPSPPVGVEAKGWTYWRRGGKTFIEGELEGAKFRAELRGHRQRENAEIRPKLTIRIERSDRKGHGSLIVPKVSADLFVMGLDHPVMKVLLWMFIGSNGSLLHKATDRPDDDPMFGELFTVMSNQHEAAGEVLATAKMALLEFKGETPIMARWPDSVEIWARKRPETIEELEALIRLGATLS